VLCICSNAVVFLPDVGIIALIPSLYFLHPGSLLINELDAGVVAKSLHVCRQFLQ